MAVSADQMVDQKLYKAKESDGLNPTQTHSDVSDNKFDLWTDLAVGEAKAAFAEGLFLDPQQSAPAGARHQAELLSAFEQVRKETKARETRMERFESRFGRSVSSPASKRTTRGCGHSSRTSLSCAGAEGVVGEKVLGRHREETR